MAQFSVKIMRPTGSVLGENQQQEPVQVQTNALDRDSGPDLDL